MIDAKNYWNCAYVRAEEHFAAAREMENQGGGKRVVRLMVASLEWYVPVVAQVVYLVDLVVSRVFRCFIGMNGGWGFVSDIEKPEGGEKCRYEKALLFFQNQDLKSRTEKFMQGYLQHSGETADRLVSKGKAEASLKPGKVGIQVKIMNVNIEQEMKQKREQALLEQEVKAPEKKV